MNLSSHTRRRVYRALVAVGGVLILYGVLGPDEVEAWLQVVNAILLVGGAGLAERNVHEDK